MEIDQFVEIYRTLGIDGLNSALKTSNGHHRLDVLRALESEGFEIKWHRDSERDGQVDDGVVWEGPRS